MNKKAFTVYAHLEHVVSLKDGELYGYWLLTRFVSGGLELSFPDVMDKEIRIEAEKMVLTTVARKILDKPLFIKIPIGMDLSYLPVLSRNFVLRIPSDTSMKHLGEIMAIARRSELKVALDGYKTIGYELNELRIGSFDYVFFSEDFYTNARQSDLERLIYNFKLFKTMIGFKNIDSEKKLRLAKSVGADLGIGYMFGSEWFPVGKV